MLKFQRGKSCVPWHAWNGKLWLTSNLRILQQNTGCMQRKFQRKGKERKGRQETYMDQIHTTVDPLVHPSSPTSLCNYIYKDCMHAQILVFGACIAKRAHTDFYIQIYCVFNY